VWLGCRLARDRVGCAGCGHIRDGHCAGLRRHAVALGSSGHTSGGHRVAQHHFAIAIPDAVLVADISRAQEVKLVVSALKATIAKQAESFPKDHRPWGWSESLVIGSRFQVKRIVVHPGTGLRLQSHHHRSEHWIVVVGAAKVTVDAEVKLLGENQSVYILQGAVHRMANPGKVPMVLIEVQTGSYFGEDDIIRYEVVYARA
jgi:mannose-1-phosphate guanylyltransferase / mannose-6-phosphate isomerase